MGPKIRKKEHFLKKNKKKGPSLWLGAQKSLTLGPETKKWLRFFFRLGPKIKILGRIYTRVSLVPQSRPYAGFPSWGVYFGSVLVFWPPPLKKNKFFYCFFGRFR